MADQAPTVEEQTEAILTEAAEEATGKPEATPTPPVEEEEVEEPEISQDPVEETPAEEEEVVEPPVSRRESKRINKLLEKLSQYEQSKPVQQRRPVPTAQQIEDGDYTTEELNQRFQQGQQEAFSAGLSQAQALTNANTFATRLDIDAPKVFAKYDYLDPESDNFDPGRTDFINRMYLSTVGYDQNTGVAMNLNLRYDEFVEGIQEMIELSATSQRADSTKNVARQAAQTGVRPGGVAKTAYQGNDPRQMTDEQLDARIAAGLGNKK